MSEKQVELRTEYRAAAILLAEISLTFQESGNHTRVDGQNMIAQDDDGWKGFAEVCNAYREVRGRYLESMRVPKIEEPKSDIIIP